MEWGMNERFLNLLIDWLTTSVATAAAHLSTVECEGSLLNGLLLS